MWTYAQELGIAAASDLQFVFKELGDRFQKQTGNSLRLSFGSSGNFFSQLQNGAPFDLFFSADIDYPKKLDSAGLVEPGSLYEYARGKIVLWVPNETPVDVTQGLKVLLDPRVKRIAIANPAHAPYGQAAVAAFKAAGIYDTILPKLVFGENISQAAHFVASGNADAGVIALSVALSSMIAGRGKYFVISADLYPPMNQAVIIMKASPNKGQAKCFLQFLRSDGVVELMKQYGFELPPNGVHVTLHEQCECCRHPR
jgi:molybdate transport system substrate-binding protein